MNTQVKEKDNKLNAPQQAESGKANGYATETFAPFIVWLQNRIGLIFCVAFAAFSFFSMFKAADFFDLVYKICMIATVLMVGGKGGIFSKPNFERVSAEPYSKAMSSFVNKSTLIIILVTALLPFFETLEMSFTMKSAYIIFSVAILGIFGVMSLFKTYSSNERKYLFASLPATILGLAGVVAFYLSYITAFVAGIGGIGEATLPSNKVFEIVYIVGVVLAVIVSHMFLSKFACVSQSVHSPLLMPILSFISLVAITVPLLAFNLTSHGDVTFIHMIVFIASSACIFVASVISSVVESCSKYISLDEKNDVRSGKAAAKLDLYKVWNFFKIKKWSAFKAVIIFVAFGIYNGVVNFFVDILMEKNVFEGIITFITTVMDNKLKWSVGFVTLLIEVIVNGLLSLLFVFICVKINEPNIKEDRVSFLPENFVGRLILIIFSIFCALIPSLFVIYGIFEKMQFANMLLWYVALTFVALMYFNLGDYVLRKARAGKTVRILLPTLLFFVAFFVERAIDLVFALVKSGFKFGGISIPGMLLNGALVDLNNLAVNVSKVAIVNTIVSIVVILLYVVYTAINYQANRSPLLAALPAALFLTTITFFASRFNAYGALEAGLAKTLSLVIILLLAASIVMYLVSFVVLLVQSFKQKEDEVTEGN